MSRPRTHVVLIPAFNPGNLLVATVEGALAAWEDVWVIVDGSTDRSHEALAKGGRAGLKVIVIPKNGGKGSAVLEGARRAISEGYTHALVMDADGQHPSERIRDFMEASAAEPASVICGKPQFGPEAPIARLYGRKLSIALVKFETSGLGASDPLFGFRVYPLGPLVRILEATRGGRRYDFDPEVAVRLAWAGIPAINIDARCAYVSRDKGGVSHFRYVRDNLRMIAMHFRLLFDRVVRGRGGRSA